MSASSDSIAAASNRHFLAIILILCELWVLAWCLRNSSPTEAMGVWQEDLTMITFLLALAVYLGVTVLLLAFVAVLSRANEDEATTTTTTTFVRVGDQPMNAMF